MEIYEKVRRSYTLGEKSQRQLARELGINRRSIQRMLKHSSPPGYQRTLPIQKPKLSSHLSWINDILESDKKAHAKQRHTAKRIHERLKEECSFTGSYSTVRTYIAKQRQRTKEMFVPLIHEPGMAQCDLEASLILTFRLFLCYGKCIRQNKGTIGLCNMGLDSFHSIMIAQVEK